MIKSAYRIYWTEYELGYGQRSDGTTLHISKENAENYIKAYKEKYLTSLFAPNIYSMPSKPFLSEISESQYKKLSLEPNGYYWLHFSKWE